MFNRPGANRIKAAEEAMAAGKLSEACDLLRNHEVSETRPARDLLTELARRFSERGQDRLLNRRFEDAIADFDQAARCGAPAAFIEDWRRRARSAMKDDAEAQKQKTKALEDAKARLAVGSIAGAIDALAHCPNPDADGHAMADNIKRQQERAVQEVQSARRAFADDHLELAVRHCRRARDLDSKADGLAALEADLVEKTTSECRDLFRDGRIDRVDQQLKTLSDVGATLATRIEIQELLRLAKEASAALSRHQYAQAGILLGRVLQLEPRATWAADARSQLEEIESRNRALAEGPLGASPADRTRDRPPILADATRIAVSSPPLIHRVAQEGQRLARKLMLRIDGVGSFLLLRGDRITVGRSGGHNPADLELISDLSERHAEIVRAGEDYFLVSMSGVELAGRPVEHALLQDGDRIRLGPRVKLRFGKPSLRSSAAYVDLTDGVRTTSDCRRIILWEGPLLLGNTRECHVAIRTVLNTSILVERDGQLFIRTMGPAGQSVPVAMGVPVDFGDLRLSLQDASRGAAALGIG
ncbi:MAG TPA: FHA domain-containing protein [Phycisphaerae bacterium]|nr:FHA domain-containing protein [Phycisphaerae bacterium]